MISAFHYNEFQTQYTCDVKQTYNHHTVYDWKNSKKTKTSGSDQFAQRRRSSNLYPYCYSAPASASSHTHVNTTCNLQQKLQDDRLQPGVFLPDPSWRNRSRIACSSEGAAGGAVLPGSPPLAEGEVSPPRPRELCCPRPRGEGS